MSGRNKRNNNRNNKQRNNNNNNNRNPATSAAAAGNNGPPASIPGGAAYASAKARNPQPPARPGNGPPPSARPGNGPQTSTRAVNAAAVRKPEPEVITLDSTVELEDSIVEIPQPKVPKPETVKKPVKPGGKILDDTIELSSSDSSESEGPDDVTDDDDVVELTKEPVRLNSTVKDDDEDEDVVIEDERIIDLNIAPKEAPKLSPVKPEITVKEPTIDSAKELSPVKPKIPEVDLNKVTELSPIKTETSASQVEEVFEGSGENDEGDEEILSKCKSSKNNTSVDSEVREALNSVDEAIAGNDSIANTPSRKRDVDELIKSDKIIDSSYVDEPSVHEPTTPVKKVKPYEITVEDLPPTCSVLKTPTATVYLVGTAHFSKESQDDVSRTIRTVQPDVIMMELCKARTNIIHMDEERILKEVKERNLGNMLETIKRNGVVHGILQLLLLEMSAQLAKEVGMAPGGEFRQAWAEAKKIPGCVIHLGDRPIDITLNRAWNSLSFFQKLKLGFNMLFSKEHISKEDIEKCKQKDLLETMLEDMAGEFPALTKVFLDERDVFLAHSLRMAGDSSILQHHIRLGSPDRQHSMMENKPTVVVGVVGIGHVPGITKVWDDVKAEDVAKVVKKIHPSTTEIIVRKVVKFSVYSAIFYGIYKVSKGPVIRALTQIKSV